MVGFAVIALVLALIGPVGPPVAAAAPGSIALPVTTSSSPLCQPQLPTSVGDYPVSVHVDSVAPEVAGIRVVGGPGGSLELENQTTEAFSVLDATMHPLPSGPPGTGMVLGGPGGGEMQGGPWDPPPAYDVQHQVDTGGRPRTYVHWTLYLRGASSTIRVSGRSDLRPRREGSITECAGAWTTLLGFIAIVWAAYALIFLGPPALLIVGGALVVRRLRRRRTPL